MPLRHFTPQEINRAQVKSGDVILVTSGAYAGTVARIRPNDVTVTTLASNFVRLLKPAEDVDGGFLGHLLASNATQRCLRSYIGGSAMPNLQVAAYKGVSVLAPPLPEQRKIAAILSSLDDAIEKTQAVIDQVQVVKRGLMQQLLTRGLPGRHTRFKHTEIGRVPEEWVVNRVSELGQEGRPAVKAGPFGSSLKKSYYVTKGYRIYGQEQVLARDFSVGDYYIDEERFQLLRSCEVRTGDVLMSLVGTFGESMVVPADIEPGIINPRLLRLSPDPRLVLPEFLCYWLQSDGTQKRLSHAAQGGTMGVINAGIVKNLRLVRPPLSEQVAIVSTLTSLEQRLDRETAVKTGLMESKSALMSVLLTGELRVKPDTEAS